MIDLQSTFEKFDDEYLKFERVENKLHSRPDICAFLLLDKLLPNDGEDIIACSEHDEYFLSVSCEQLAEVVTEEDILMLVRCGIHYNEDLESLSSYS